MGFLPMCLLGCLYFLVSTFITVFKYFKGKSQSPINGKITKLKSAKNHFDGKNTYKQYVYEFSTKNGNETIDYIETTSTKKKSKISVGMVLDLFYNHKTKQYESIQKLKSELLSNIIGVVLFAAIFVIGCIILSLMN